jgi:hypothetical protein
LFSVHNKYQEIFPSENTVTEDNEKAFTKLKRKKNQFSGGEFIMLWELA